MKIISFQDFAIHQEPALAKHPSATAIVAELAELIAKRESLQEIQHRLYSAKLDDFLPRLICELLPKYLVEANIPGNYLLMGDNGVRMRAKAAITIEPTNLRYASELGSLCGIGIDGAIIVSTIADADRLNNYRYVNIATRCISRQAWIICLTLDKQSNIHKVR